MQSNDPLTERGQYQSSRGPQIINEKGEINIPKFINNEYNFILFGEMVVLLFICGMFCVWRIANFVNTTADHASEIIFDIRRGDKNILLARKNERKVRKQEKLMGKTSKKKDKTNKRKSKNRQSWIVIGGNGFIGKKIVESILSDSSLSDVEVIVFDSIIPEYKGDRDDRVTYVQGSITIREHLDRLMRINDRWDEKIEVVNDLDEFQELEEDDDGNYLGIQKEGMLDPGNEESHLRTCKYPPSRVFLCAGLMSSIEHTDDDLQLVNGMGAMNVIDSCINANVQNFIYTSCASIALNAINNYDKTKEKKNIIDIDQDEKYFENKYHVPDNDIPYFAAKPDFIDLNAKLKAMTEEYIKDVCNEYKTFHAISLRPSIVIGLNDKYFLQSVLNGTQICIIGDGTNIIDFVYVNDVAKTHVEAAKILPQRKYKGDAFFLTSSSNSITLNDLLGVKESKNDDDNTNDNNNKDDGEEKENGEITPVTKWGLPLPVYITIEEAKEMVAWNEQIYYKTTVARYDVRLTLSTIYLFQSSWWFNSNKAKKELNWNPHEDLRLLIQKCLNDQEEKRLMLKDPNAYELHKKEK